MKTLSKIIVYALCLQLTVGSYPIQNRIAYAEDSEVSRGPASETLNMTPDEAADYSKNYIRNFDEQCTNPKGEILGDVAFMHDREIGGEEPRMYNCGAAAEVIQKVITPAMNDITAEAKNAAKKPYCASGNCGVPEQEIEAQKGPDEVACTLQEQKKFAKDADQCSFACNLGLQTKGCPASSGVSGKCVAELGKGILNGVIDILTFPFVLLKDIGSWTWKKLTGDNESKTSEKNHALAGLSDQDIKDGKENPEKLKGNLLSRAAAFFTEFGKAVSGYSEFEQQAKCTDCAGKADLMCAVIGKTTTFSMTLFGNGLVFGATKGIATRIAGKMVKISKGTGILAKTTAKVIKATGTTGKFVAKPFIGMGNIIVKGGSTVSQGTIRWWEGFKASKTYANLAKFKNTQLYKKALSAESIPGKITLKVGRGIGKGFKKMGEFEDRMFMKGVKFTNKELHGTMLRAQNINKLRAARLENEADISKSAKANSAVSTAEDSESLANKEALRGVTELNVVRDVVDARPIQEWSDIKKAASNRLSGVKMKHLDDIENLTPTEFAVNAGKEKSILVDTSNGSREVKLAHPEEAEKVYTYQDAKYAVVENKDGSYIIHDMDGGKHLTQAPKGHEEFDALLGKGTKKYGKDLEEISYEQVKTNLRINETKFTEEVNAATGARTLKIETPTGCNPKYLRFGVDKAI